MHHSPQQTTTSCFVIKPVGLFLVIPIHLFHLLIIYIGKRKRVEVVDEDYVAADAMVAVLADVLVMLIVLIPW